MNSVALAIGNLLFREEDFVYREYSSIYYNRRYKLFCLFFQKHGFEVSLSKVNFYLVRDPGQNDQYPLFAFLLEKGIVPRHTFNFPGLEGRWLRFAIRTSEENQKLMEAMREMAHDSSIIFITGGVRHGKSRLLQKR